MNNLTRKQLEIRNRESRILELARPRVAREGISGLSMDQIAREMDYAKGTIYNHFSCKEEILLALAIQASETRIAMFQSASDSQSSSRNRMAAIGVACEEYRLRYPDLFDIELLVRHSTVWDKASEERCELLANCEHRCMAIVASIAADAVAAGDLQLKRRRKIEDLVFGLWSVTFGGMMIDASSPGLQRIGIKDTYAAIRRNGNALMDGFGWLPLYEAAAYRKLVAGVRKHLAKDVPEIITAKEQSDAIG